MSEQLKEKVRVSTPHLPDQEEISRGLDVPDVNARLRRWKHRRRTTKEVLVFMLPMALMAVLLIAGIIFSQITPAATPSTASTSTNTAPTVAVPPHPTYNALAPTTPQGS